MNKKTIIIISSCIILFFLLGMISFIIAKNTKDIKQYDDEKMDSQIKQIDYQIIKMLNYFDNKNEQNIDWNGLKSDINTLYTSWNSVIIDFSLLDIDNNDLTDFGKKIDAIMITVQNRDINKTKSNLSDLYSFLVQYTNCYQSNIILKNNITTKYYLIKAYILLDTNNWTLVNENINNATMNFYQNINIVEIAENQKFNLNKTYVAINELKNTVANKNKELFYIKYKIAMEEIEKIK